MNRTRPIDSAYAVEVEGLRVLCIDVTWVGGIWPATCYLGARRRLSAEDGVGGKKATVGAARGGVRTTISKSAGPRAKSWGQQRKPVTFRQGGRE